MRPIPLSTAFDLAKGDNFARCSNDLLSKNKACSRCTPRPSDRQMKLRGAKGHHPALASSTSRCGRAADCKPRTAATALAATPVGDRCSTPITELYRAIHKIGVETDDSECTGERQLTSRPTGVEELPSPAAAPSPAQGEWEQVVIYETSPKPRPVDAIPAPHTLGDRGVAPLNTPRRVAARGGSQHHPPLVVQDAPQALRGDELVILCRIEATVPTLCQRGQPDPRSPLERPQGALPMHTCCSLARQDARR